MQIMWDNLIDVENQKAAENAPLQEKAALVGRIGLMMLSVGAGAYRVRAAMNKLSRALNITCNADIGLLSIEYTCLAENQAYTNALSIHRSGVNTDKFYQLRVFTKWAAESVSRYSIKQFFVILDDLDKAAGSYSTLTLSLSAAFACAALTFLLGGDHIECLLAFLGAGTGNFIRRKMLKKHITLYANVAVSVAAACLVYIALEVIFHKYLNIFDDHHEGYICSMLFVIPGFPLITGGIDLAKLDIRSGLERICYSFLIIFVAALTGWLCAYFFNFFPRNFDPMALNHHIKLILRFFASIISIYGFSIMFNSSRKMALLAALIGCLPNVLRLELIDYTNLPFQLIAFLASFLAGLLASAIKKFTGFPRTTITVPSIVVMVPGLYMYKGMYFFALEDYGQGAVYFTKAIMVICALALGLIFARILTDKNFRTSS